MTLKKDVLCLKEKINRCYENFEDFFFFFFLEIFELWGVSRSVVLEYVLWMMLCLTSCYGRLQFDELTTN